jgi:hypothetical protein
MPNDAVLRAADTLPHLCKKLRWKSRAIDAETPENLLFVLSRGGVTFTCLTTADAAGEDTRLVAPEACHPNRSCYVEDPLLSLARRNRSVA